MSTFETTQTLSDFQQNPAKFVKQVQETGQPLVLTVDGEPAVVVQDVDMYERYYDSNEYRETVAVLRKRLADIDNPEKWPTAKEVFDQVRKKYNIPRD